MAHVVCGNGRSQYRRSIAAESMAGPTMLFALNLRLTVETCAGIKRGRPRMNPAPRADEVILGAKGRFK